MQRQDAMLVDLPRELLLIIGMTLAPEEIISLASVNRHFRDLLQMSLTDLNNFWKQKFKLHFPDFFEKYSLAKRTDIDWFDLFKQEYLITYKYLSNNLKKAVSIFKENITNQSLSYLNKSDPDVFKLVQSLKNLKDHIEFQENIFAKSRSLVRLPSNLFGHTIRQRISLETDEEVSTDIMNVCLNGQDPYFLNEYIIRLGRDNEHLYNLFIPLLEEIQIPGLMIACLRIPETLCQAPF